MIVGGVPMLLGGGEEGVQPWGAAGTFDPSYSSNTLTNGNLTANTTGPFYSSLGTIGITSGIRVFEVTLAGNSYDYSFFVGVGNRSMNLNSFTGSDANGWGYFSLNGNKYNGSGGVAYGASYVIGNVMGIKLDLGAGTLTFYKNGVSQGTAFTGLSGTFYPAVTLRENASLALSLTANFGATAFTYTYT